MGITARWTTRPSAQLEDARHAEVTTLIGGAIAVRVLYVDIDKAASPPRVTIRVDAYLSADQRDALCDLVARDTGISRVTILP